MEQMTLSCTAQLWVHLTQPISIYPPMYFPRELVSFP